MIYCVETRFLFVYLKIVRNYPQFNCISRRAYYCDFNAIILR